MPRKIYVEQKYCDNCACVHWLQQDPRTLAWSCAGAGFSPFDSASIVKRSGHGYTIATKAPARIKPLRPKKEIQNV